jgi:thaumarchaeosortase
MKTTLSHASSKVGLVPHDFYPLLAVAPVVVFHFRNPKMFEVDFVGYATFAYVSFFVAINFFIFRTLAKPSNKINYKGTILSIATIFLYQLIVYGIGFSKAITEVGAFLGVSGLWLENTWLISVDLTAFAFYLTGLTVSFFGFRSLKKLSAPIVYLFLTVSSFLLNAFYPFASFTAFQILIPYIVNSVGNILPFFGINARYSSLQDPNGQTRSLIVVNEPRFLALEVNWPCAGIFSILIYFAIMYSLLQIWNTTKKRKIIYLTVGFIGTVLTNILRIVTLILLYSFFNADILVFHQYIGALFFVAWITVFLSIIFLVEKKRVFQVKLVEKRMNTVYPEACKEK